MTVEQAVALIGALTAFLGAIAAVLIQLHQLHSKLNGRLDQLLAQATVAAQKEGELAGRDYVRKELAGQPGAVTPDVRGQAPLQTPPPRGGGIEGQSSQAG